LSRDKDNESFSRGLSEELINTLATIDGSGLCYSVFGEALLAIQEYGRAGNIQSISDVEGGRS
jgi:hypothetical protein